MKTTELWIEQVLIGALGIAIVLSPWLPEIVDGASEASTLTGLAGGSLALGFAFWLGIPLDRLADTLTDRLDRHARLRFALKRAKGRLLPRADDRGRLDRDLGPEDRLRIASLRDSDAAVSWIDYHRSRIRLTRALAVYAPALTVTLTLGLERMRPDGAHVSAIWLAGVLVAYLAWALLARLGLEVPRTDAVELLDYAKTWGFADAAAERVVKTEIKDFSVWGAEWPGLVVPVALLAVALWLASWSPDPRTWVAAGAGAAITAVSAWAWWRIGFTYRTYLHDLDRHAR